jgi:hypothetical protein
MLPSFGPGACKGGGASGAVSLRWRKVVCGIKSRLAKPRVLYSSTPLTLKLSLASRGNELLRFPPVRSCVASLGQPANPGRNASPLFTIEREGYGVITPDPNLCPKAGFWPDLSLHLWSERACVKKAARIDPPGATRGPILSCCFFLLCTPISAFIIIQSWGDGI